MTHTATLVIAPDATLRDAIAIIDRGARQIALVVDEAGVLIATVTDGDVRRGLLRGLGLDAPVSEVMNRSPLTVRAKDGHEAAHRVMRARSLHHIPIVDDHGRFVDLAWIDEVSGLVRRETQVVLMAGGLGRRLRPLTETVPKPMLPIGGRPILEHILRSFVDQGFYRFLLSVNYKAAMLYEHFGDGSRFGVSIEYLHEKERLGTAGALSLLRERPTQPLIVMNGDLLTSVNFRQLLEFHNEHGGHATMCVREYSVQVPYGVVETDHHRLSGLTEKPIHHFFVNAGIYVIQPEALDLIPTDRMFDMPDLFEALLAKEQPACVFPIREYWLDIGRFDDLERAQMEYGEVCARSEPKA